MINYNRRATHVVEVGTVAMGGDNPIRVQSMLTTNTNDTEACVKQTIEIVQAGGELVRLSTQGVKEAKNMAVVKQVLLEQKIDVPLIADVHFNPLVADEAALHIEKVRINPGNYASTLADIKAKFVPFLGICKQHGTAIRIGVNHGSLHQRILNQYGDTPEGMTVSCLEFLRICVEENFTDVVISIKSSNTRVMVQTVRRITRCMQEEGMSFPLHLGVTEAGEGEDGRIKSAVGTGTLLSDGLGDTIRVSLSEHPAAEIPVAKNIVDFIERKAAAPLLEESNINLFDPENFNRRKSRKVGEFGQNQVPVVLDAKDKVPQGVLLLNLDHENALGQGRLFFAKLKENGDDSPVLISRTYTSASLEQVQIEAAIELGAFFMDGLGDGIQIIAPNLSSEAVEQLALGILQASRSRMSKTEYISCPSCGRTLFDMQAVIPKIKAATQHLKTLKIGIMGCIVNGPGEMADADYGYVGSSAGCINLYKGKTCILKGVPEKDAVEQLIELIKSEGDWIEP